MVWVDGVWFDVPLFWALFAFSVVAFFTPGPNNVLTFIYALRYGTKTAVLFRIGILVASPLIHALVVGGMLPFFETYPLVLQVMSYISLVLILYIAYSVMTSNPDLKSNQNDIVVMGVISGALFQIVNPKNWSLGLAMSSLYTDPNMPILSQVITVFSVVFIINIISPIPWLLGGLYFREYFEKPSRMRIFNIVMGLSLIVMAVYSFVAME